MKKLFLTGLISLLFTNLFSQVVLNFNDGNLAGWTTGPYALIAESGAMKVTANGVGPGFEAFSYNFDPLDMSVNSNLTINLKVDQPTTVRIDLLDINGFVSNAMEVSFDISNTDFELYKYSFAGKFSQGFPTNATLDPTKITGILIYFNPGGSVFNGTVYIDDLAIAPLPSPGISLSQLDLNYSKTLINTSKIKEIALTNPGEEILTITSSEISPGFEVTGLPMSVEPGATASFEIDFRPTESKVYSGELSIASNAAFGNSVIALSGEGVTEIPVADLSEKVRVNQIGYYPNREKIGVVVDGTASMEFNIRTADLDKILYTGALSTQKFWDKSGENVAIADFSDFSMQGNFVLEVPEIGRSYPFQIASQVMNGALKASVKAYYFNRASTELLTEHAGVYARAAGHPDTEVVVHASAASAARPENTTISSPGGWYDAGDFGKYIVNGGIAVHTLLASYEAFTEFYQDVNLNIPESNNSMPDILDEVLYELEWMLTMQDPADGGVYHKLTTSNFVGIVMPSENSETRYVYLKSTAAALNFAAVMAQASRIYKAFDAAKSTVFLDASKDAWAWAKANPTTYYVQQDVNAQYDPDVNTGEYGDTRVSDEFTWAGTELYITTLDGSYLADIDFSNSTSIPDWPNTHFLAHASLLNNESVLTSDVDMTQIKSNVLGLANTLKSRSESAAYKMSHNSFNWGSNSAAGNEGMVLFYAFRETKDESYLNAALGNFDYILGRNALNFSFLTGFGSNSITNIHHRQAEADGIAAPIPGFIGGGPYEFWSSNDFCTGIDFGNIPAKAFQDVFCSPPMTEVAVNWNAPFVFLASAFESINASLTSESITPPSDLVGDGLSTTSIKLTWEDNTVDETGFSLERRLEKGGSYEVIASQDSDMTSYQDESLEVGTAYAYRIRAVKGDSVSNYSSELIVSTLLPPPPTTPSNLMGTVSSTSIDLTWMDNADGEKGYRLYQSLDQVTFELVTELSENSESYTQNGLIPATTYQYKLYAFHDFSKSDSLIVAFTTKDIPPVAPSDFISTLITATEIELAWSDNSNNETGFKLYQSTDMTNFSLLAELGSDMTSYKDEGLTPNTAYTYRIEAFNTEGASELVEHTITTLNETPAAPSGLEGIGVDMNTVTINWTDNSDIETGTVIERSLAESSGFMEVTIVATDITTYTDDKLEGGTEYFYRVKARNTDVDSDYSSIASAKTDEVVLEISLKETQVTIYPNPVSEKLHIDLSNPNQWQTATVINGTGEIIALRMIESDELNISTSHLAKGVYVLLLKGTEGIKVLRFLK